MDVYIELTYIINAFIYIVVFEILAILLNINWSLKKILSYSFLCNISLILIYIDYLPYVSLFYWFFMFMLLFRKQIFLYFPAYIIVYFSILLFIHTLIENSFIYNGILITPASYTDIAVICVSLIFVVIEYMYVVYARKKIVQDQYFYDVQFVYHHHTYTCQGFLDSGNNACYHGFPLVFIKMGMIKDYQSIDICLVDSLSAKQVEIIQVESFWINDQLLHDVYIGMIDHMQYDCLLNKELMGGIL